MMSVLCMMRLRYMFGLHRRRVMTVGSSEEAWRELGARSETRYLAVAPRGILNSAAATNMPFWSINPYIGCEFGCAYCYARETHRWTVDRALKRGEAAAVEITGLPPTIAFERRIVVKEGAAAVLARVLPRAPLGVNRVMFGTATDPYQPAERRFGITRSLLEVFLKHEGLRIGVITKSALITRDTALFAALVKRHDVTVSISLASVDAALLRQMEPRTPVPRARLRAMRALADVGVRVGLLAAPILPGINDGAAGLRALLGAAAAHGARWTRYGTLRMGTATRATLYPWLERNRPDLVARYRRHYGAGQGVSKEYYEAFKARFERLRAASGIPAESSATGVGEQAELWPAGSVWD
jgi:DNA repair photolyase